ncbi:MAG: hypothetical protein EXS15_06595 [Phycisphaerales bacterium]|nr:hypothetical protein [Phycisphaerales bacterium]
MANQARGAERGLARIIRRRNHAGILHFPAGELPIRQWMRVSLPFFNPDPGWLFLVAGIALIVSAAVIPEADKVHEMRGQLQTIRFAEQHNFARMEACSRFLDDLKAGDHGLVRRLAASQLNLMPRGETALLIATSIDATPSDWIEASVTPPVYEPEPYPDTLLSRWTLGPQRLWVIAVGAFSIFLGLILGPTNRIQEKPI